MPRSTSWRRRPVPVVTRLDDVRFVIDENLLRMAKGVVPVRRDTAVFSSPPVEELLPSGILDTEWIPVVGERGWVVITSDRRLRTRPAEASLAIAHKLQAVHLHGLGERPAWDQLVRLVGRWSDIEKQVESQRDGAWWLSLCAKVARLMRFEPGAVESA